MKIGRSTLEACHEGPSDLDAWLANLAPLLSRDLGRQTAMAVMDAPAMQVRTFQDPDHALQLDLIADAAAPGSVPVQFRQEFFDEMGARTGMNGHSVFKLFFAPFRVSTANSLVGHLFDVARFVPRFAPGYGDICCARADAAGLTLTTVLPLRAGDALRANDRQLLRLQRHLEGAFGARVLPSWHQSTVVFDGSGQAVHRDALLPVQTEDLASLVAKGMDERAEPDGQAEQLWDELWRQGWTVARVNDADGRRYLTLRRSAPDAPGLSAVERRVVALARDGFALKGIALELGISMAGASTHLQSGLRKLGLKHRLELERLR